MKQGTFHFKISNLCRAGPCNDYNVQTTIEHALVQSVTFPDQSGDSVSHHTVPNFFTHADPKSVFIKAIFLYDHYKIFVGVSSAVLVNKLELVVFL